MKSLAELRLLIDNELKNIQSPKKPQSLYDPIQYILGLKAKRIRPILLLISHQLFNNNFKKALSPAIGIEVFHNFTLLHDDIMDKAVIRRGFQTVHEKWNNNTAILSGDTMLIKSYQLIMDVDINIVKQVLDVFSKAAVKVCQGQQWDMDFENEYFVNIPDYIRMIEYKTSALLSASLQIGAITGGADLAAQESLYNFGRNIGIAFQLKDDFLDLFGDSNIFGKEQGGDIKSNKKTYLYIKALSIANNKQKIVLENYFNNKYTDNELKIQEIKSIFSELLIPEATTKLIKEYHKKAMINLDSLEISNKEYLSIFADKLLERID